MNSKFILGTAQFGFDYGINNPRGKILKKEVFKILKYAWESKIRFLDTAAGYDESERIIGEFIKKYKFNFKIITGEPSQCTAKNLKGLFLKSLQSLNQNKVYGYLIHNFDHFLKDKKIWQVLGKLKAEGKIKNIGFSLYYPEQFKIILKKNIKPDIIQVPYNFLDQRFARQFSFIESKGIKVYIRSVFLQGLIFKNPKTLNKKFTKLKEKLIFLNTLAKKTSIPISTMAINFVLLNRNVDKIIYGVNSLKNLQENIKAIKYQNNVNNIYKYLLELKEDDENIILPINWF